MTRAVTPQDIVVTPTGARFMGRTLPCTVGRGGVVADKREGDGGTPVGVHRIVGMLYRPDRMAAPTDWAVPIRPGDLWCDDPGHADYNLMVRAPLEASHEALRRADPLYDLVLLTDWNWPRAERGRGSAIFLHRWRRPGYPTEGCVAFAPKALRWMAGRISLRTRMIVTERTTVHPRRRTRLPHHMTPEGMEEIEMRAMDLLESLRASRRRGRP